MKKYEITDIAHPDNPNLHRIRAVTDLTEDVLAGMLGGYILQMSNYKVLLDTGMTLKGSRKYFSKAKLEFYRGR